MFLEKKVNKLIGIRYVYSLYGSLGYVHYIVGIWSVGDLHSFLVLWLDAP